MGLYFWMKLAIYHFLCNPNLTAIEKGKSVVWEVHTQNRPIDVRLICATNADIRQMVEDGISVRTYYIVSTRLKYIYLHP